MFRRETVLGDLSAALTVTMVALPLNLALAVACGLPPHAGLVSAAIGGALGALLGGSRFQITGPEVALAPMTLAIASAHGPSGLMIATVISGVLQLVLAALRWGGLVRAVPRAVVGGFMAAVGILVLDTQLPRLLGLEDVSRLSSLRSLDELLAHLGDTSFAAVAIGTLVVILFVAATRGPRWLPAPLLALSAGVGLTAILDLPVQRIEPIAGASIWPELPSLARVDWLALLPSAVALALLSSLDSLLCAVSIDGRTGERHHSDQELFAQGVANIATGLLGGMPVAAAVVRSVVAVESRARTRLAALAQSGMMMVVVLALGAHLDHIPLAALAGVLLVVGAKLVRLDELRALAVLSRGEAAVFVATAIAILALDFVEGVVVGVALSLALLSRQLRDTLRARVAPSHGAAVVILGGALFSASQDRLRALVEASLGDARAVVLDVRELSALDASGAAALRGAVEKLEQRGIAVQVAAAPSMLAGLRAELRPSVVHPGRDEALAALRPGSERPAPLRTAPPRRADYAPSLAAD
jgi:sulfate permease, SulP family